MVSEAFKELLSKTPEGQDILNDIKNKICPFCKQPISEFRDEISIQEYLISGLCQTCQDNIFGQDD